MNAASKSERLKTGLDLLDRYGTKPKEKGK